MGKVEDLRDELIVATAIETGADLNFLAFIAQGLDYCSTLKLCGNLSRLSNNKKFMSMSQATEIFSAPVSESLVFPSSQS